MTQALTHLDQALELNPTYVPARTARGSLYYQEGKFDSAVKDLEIVESAQPEDAANLDRLGQTYQALDRTADAVRVLRRAAALAPDDSKTLLHFARALADDGQLEESKVVMNRFRQLGPEKRQGVPAGLVEYLSLAPEQRHAEYRARVERAVRDHPEDSAAQLVYLKLMLEDGNTDQVAAAAKRIAALKPGAAVLAGAGRALLEGNQYALARELLRQAAVADPQAGDVALDLAVATFRAASPATGAKAGLDLMDRIPESARRSDYYLARAQMLYASGKIQDADSALDEALQGAPKRPDLFQQATAFLVRNGRASEALRRIAEAARILPENREILLLKATTLEFARQADDAEHLLNEIQNQWPEWSAVRVAHGMILHAHQHYGEAQQALETAVALGARGSETYFFLADCMLRSGAERKSAMDSVIRQALQLSPDDWWIQSLAGRIAFAGGEYQLAVERQRAAIRRRPHFVAAHKGLAQAYAALGRKQEAEAELEQIRMIGNDPGPDDEPPYMSSLFQGSLFKEKPPRVW
jgi:tetratricopeptide (TPR) repeat protein